jgi:hypothetical protein
MSKTSTSRKPCPLSARCEIVRSIPTVLARIHPHSFARPSVFPLHGYSEHTIRAQHSKSCSSDRALPFLSFQVTFAAAASHRSFAIVRLQPKISPSARTTQYHDLDQRQKKYFAPLGRTTGGPSNQRLARICSLNAHTSSSSDSRQPNEHETAPKATTKCRPQRLGPSEEPRPLHQWPHVQHDFPRPRQVFCK